MSTVLTDLWVRLMIRHPATHSPDSAKREKQPLTLIFHALSFRPIARQPSNPNVSGVATAVDSSSSIPPVDHPCGLPRPTLPLRQHLQRLRHQNQQPWPPYAVDYQLDYSEPKTRSPKPTSPPASPQQSPPNYPNAPLEKQAESGPQSPHQIYA